MDTDYDYTHEQIADKYGNYFQVSETVKTSDIGKITRTQIECLVFEYFTEKYDVSDCEVYTRLEINNELSISVKGMSHLSGSLLEAYLLDFIIENFEI